MEAMAVYEKKIKRIDAAAPWQYPKAGFSLQLAAQDVLYTCLKFLEKRMLRMYAENSLPMTLSIHYKRKRVYCFLFRTITSLHMDKEDSNR